MVFVELLIAATIFAMVVVAATQVVLPLATNRPLFPAFRRKRRELEENLADASNSVDNAKLTKEVKRTETEAEKIARDGSPDPKI
ncbi:MAG: hypothetical protein AAB568_00460 [Patescibacteria group bacterium]